MITVAKRKLKAGMSAYFRHVEKTREELIVTDRRRPVLRISPICEKRPAEEVFADLRGKSHATAVALCAPTLSEWSEA